MQGPLRKFWRAETGIFLALWLMLLIGGRSRLFLDPGTFWHTVVGEKLLASHRFENTDSFTWTFSGQPWIPHQWLGECTMAAIHAIAGLDSLLLATATLLAAIFTWCAHRLIRAGVHWSLAVSLVMLGVGASSGHFHIRPHLVTIAFLACSFALLCDVEAGRVARGRLAWLIPLFVVWTNVHGGMLGGLATLGFVFAWWSLGWLLRRQTPVQSGRQIVLLLGLFVVCGMTALVNPYGAAIPRTWMAIMDSPILPSIIREHAPLSLVQPDGILVLLLGGVYIFALSGLKPQWPRGTWLVPLLWLAQAFLRIRHAPLFAVTALLSLAEVLPQTCWALWLQRRSSGLFRASTFQASTASQPFNWRQLILPAAVILLAVALQAERIEAPILGWGHAQLDDRVWPTELLPKLFAEEAKHPEGTRVFNEYTYGGFLIYFTPRLKPFVDDRCELFGDRWLLDFVDAENKNTATRLEEYQKQYGNFDLALVRTGSGYDEYFLVQPEWEVAGRTKAATLYRRKNYDLNSSGIGPGHG